MGGALLDRIRAVRSRHSINWRRYDAIGTRSKTWSAAELLGGSKEAAGRLGPAYRALAETSARAEVEILPAVVAS
jgi:hypothetical protein